jgi:hypothetical protein
MKFADGNSLGHCHFGDFDRDAHRGKGIEPVMPCLVQIMAGPVAENSISPGIVLGAGPGKTDYDIALMIAVVALHDGQVPENGEVSVDVSHPKYTSALDLAIKEAGRLVDANQPTIAKTADLLLKRTRLAGDEVFAIVNAA